MDTRLPSKFVHTAFAAAIVSLLSEGAGAQQCALPQNCAPTTGNVGIGTTSPATKLHVVGPGGGGVVATFDQPTGINFVDLRALNTGSGRGGTALRFFGAPAITDAPTAEIRGTANGQLRFATINLGPIVINALDRVVIDNFGNVGIGTEPGRTLDVEGPIVAANGSSAFLVAADAGGAASLWTNASYNRGAPFDGWFRTLNMKDGKVGVGTTDPQAQLDVVGMARTSTLQITGGADLSEHFEVRGAAGAGSASAASPIQAGLVVSIDPDEPGKLVVSSQAYDHTVAGIISGGGGVRPGMLMSQPGSMADGDHPVALTGRVYCWADASYGPIAPGDLLTTSDTPGHAMKVTDYAKARGAVLGKAMAALKQGKGLVLVLVSLQ